MFLVFCLFVWFFLIYRYHILSFLLIVTVVSSDIFIVVVFDFLSSPFFNVAILLTIVGIAVLIVSAYVVIELIIFVVPFIDIGISRDEINILDIANDA